MALLLHCSQLPHLTHLQRHMGSFTSSYPLPTLRRHQLDSLATRQAALRPLIPSSPPARATRSQTIGNGVPPFSSATVGTFIDFFSLFLFWEMLNPFKDMRETKKEIKRSRDQFATLPINRSKKKLVAQGIVTGYEKWGFTLKCV